MLFLRLRNYTLPPYKRTGEKQDERPILEQDRTGEHGRVKNYGGKNWPGENYFLVFRFFFIFKSILELYFRTNDSSLFEPLPLKSSI